MLIWIDVSVLSADLAVDLDACCGVSGIFDAVYRGEHYALGERATLTALANNSNLSQFTRKIIKTILSNLPMLGGIAREMTVRLNVIHGSSVGCKRVAPSNWEVPLKELGLYGINKTVLLTENLDDARAFEHAARQYQVFVKMSGHIAVEKSGGGGSTTPSIFENFTKTERRWCLCITDSDRLHPNANLDKTAQKCNDIAADNSIVATHTDLAFREIENILPTAFLAEVIPPTHREKWDWHMARLNVLRPDAHKYCDIKQGITLRKIKSYSKESPVRTYWESVARDLEKASALTCECTSLEDCERSDEESCECFVGYGFGERLLDMVVRILDHRTPQYSETMTRHDLNRDAWMAIGCIVFEWCCAPQKMRL